MAKFQELVQLTRFPPASVPLSASSSQFVAVENVNPLITLGTGIAVLSPGAKPPPKHCCMPMSIAAPGQALRDADRLIPLVAEKLAADPPHIFWPLASESITESVIVGSMLGATFPSHVAGCAMAVEAQVS